MQLLHPTPSETFFWIKLGSKNKKHPFTRFQGCFFYNMNFNSAHCANFNFAHFEIFESFELIWVKLQNSWFDFQISISSIHEVLISSMGFIFAHFVYERSFGKTWVKITEWSISNRFENFHFGAHYTN